MSGGKGGGGMIGFWNDEEDAALQGLSLEAQIIYLRGIRRFSSKDGVAGIDRRINRASLSEVCHFIPERRSHKTEVRLSWDQVRRRLDELERAGLIEPRGNMVFFLPLAVSDESVQMKTTRRRHVDDTPLTTLTEPLQRNDFSDDDDMMMTRRRHAVDDTTSPVTFNNTYVSNARGNSGSVVPLKRPVPADYKPSRALLSWCIHRGYGDPAPYLDHFINTCHANGYQYADFDAAFKNAIDKDWAGIRSQRTGSGKQRGSVPDNSDTSWLTDDLLEDATK